MKRFKFQFISWFLVLCAITTAVYWTHFQNPFQFDDAHTIQTNAAIKDLANIPLFFVDATTNSSMPENCAYRPLQSTMDALDWAIGNGKTWSFHVHIFCWFLILGWVIAVLSYRLLLAQQLIAPHEYTWPFMVSFVILLHPMSAETVNYICARSDGFSAVCMVLTLLWIIAPPARAPRIWIVPFVLGMLTKQSALMVAPLVWVYAAVVSPTPRVHVKQGLWISGFALLGYVFIQLLMTPATTASVNTGISPGLYFMNQTRVILFYISQFFVPNRLHADPHFDVLPASDPILIGSLIGLLAISVLAIAAQKLKGGALITFGWFWYILGLAPTSSFLPLFQTANFHRPFFSNIGLALACITILCMVIRYFSSQKYMSILLTGMLALVLGVFSILTWHRHQVWKSDAILWQEVAELSPTNGRAWLNLGLVKMRDARWNEAEADFRKAEALMPNWLYVHLNLGILYQTTNRPADAELAFLKARTLARNNAEPYLWYAKFLIQQQRIAEAEQQISAGLLISPLHQGLQQLSQDIQPLLNDASVQADAFIVKSLQAYEQANYMLMIEYCRQALALKPNYSVAYNNICSAYIQLNQLDSAAWYCQKAIQADSANAYAQQNYQWILNQKP